MCGIGLGSVVGKSVVLCMSEHKSDDSCFAGRNHAGKRDKQIMKIDPGHPAGRWDGPVDY